MNIADSRELMFEARAIENILTASRDAAKRRRRPVSARRYSAAGGPAGVSAIVRATLS